MIATWWVFTELHWKHHLMSSCLSWLKCDRCPLFVHLLLEFKC
jgi:hypothetical protein